MPPLRTPEITKILQSDFSIVFPCHIDPNNFFRSVSYNLFNLTLSNYLKHIQKAMKCPDRIGHICLVKSFTSEAFWTMIKMASASVSTPHAARARIRDREIVQSVWMYLLCCPLSAHVVVYGQKEIQCKILFEHIDSISISIQMNGSTQVNVLQRLI